MIVIYRFPGGIDGWQRESELAVKPSIGDTVHGPDDAIYRVTTVALYPWGDFEADADGTEHPPPYVYVILRAAL